MSSVYARAQARSILSRSTTDTSIENMLRFRILSLTRFFLAAVLLSVASFCFAHDIAGKATFLVYVKPTDT
jgi:hypothetical protein